MAEVSRFCELAAGGDDVLLDRQDTRFVGWMRPLEVHIHYCEIQSQSRASRHTVAFTGRPIQITGRKKKKELTDQRSLASVHAKRIAAILPKVLDDSLRQGLIRERPQEVVRRVDQRFDRWPPHVIEDIFKQLIIILHCQRPECLIETWRLRRFQLGGDVGKRGDAHCRHALGNFGEVFEYRRRYDWVGVLVSCREKAFSAFDAGCRDEGVCLWIFDSVDVEPVESVDDGGVGADGIHFLTAPHFALRERGEVHACDYAEVVAAAAKRIVQVWVRGRRGIDDCAIRQYDLEFVVSQCQIAKSPGRQEAQMRCS